MKKHLLLLFLFFTSSVFAEELILKVKNSPCIAGWIYQNGSLENSYCLYEKNHIILASSLPMYQMQNPILHVFKEGEKDIISVHFSLSNKTFISLDERGILTERSFANAKHSKKRLVHEKLKVASCVISPDDKMEIIGFENGFLQTHSLLKKSKKDFDVFSKAHQGAIYSISFTPMGTYFLTTSLDKTCKIWKSNDLSLVREFSVCTENKMPCIFSPLNDSFLYSSSSNMLVISDIEGKNINTIFVNNGIKMAHFTEKKDVISVLNAQKQIEFYSISSGKYLGTLPSLFSFSINSFDVNIITGNILASTNEGEIYLCTPNEIKNVKLAKKDDIQQNKKKNVIESKTILEDKNEKNEFSENVLEYWGLEEAPNVEKNIKKPHFSIKNETPLEEPMQIGVKAKDIQAKKEKPLHPKNTTTLNQTVFDEEDFPKNTEKPTQDISKDESLETDDDENQEDEEADGEIKDNESDDDI